MMRVGEHIGLPAQIVVRGFSEPRKDVGVQQPEALLGERQARRQRHNFSLHLGVERLERPPGWLRHGATGTPPSVFHSEPMLLPR